MHSGGLQGANSVWVTDRAKDSMQCVNWSKTLCIFWWDMLLSVLLCKLCVPQLSILKVKCSQDNSRGATLKSAPVKSMNLWDWQINPHVSSCSSIKQTVVLGRPLWPTPVSSSVAICTGPGTAHWSTLTCTLLCSGSGAWLGTVSLIHKDKCKHVKSQTRAVWRGTVSHHPPPVFSGGSQRRHTLHWYPSAVVSPGLKHSTHPMSIWL